MKINRIARWCVGALFLPFLVSCGALGGGAIGEDIAEARQAAEDLIAEADPEGLSRPLVTMHDGPYLAGRRIAHHGAVWLHEAVEIRAAGLPFDLCLAKAVEQLDEAPSVVFAADLAERGRVVTLDHRGSFRDFSQPAGRGPAASAGRSRAACCTGWRK